MEHSKTDSDWTRDILGYHLGLSDEKERAELEARFERPQELQTLCEALGRRLSVLDADIVEPPPADLADRILRRVETSRQILPFRRPADLPAGDAEPVAAGGPLLSMRELVGLAAAILIFVGIFIPGYYTAREAARKIACAGNLRSIGIGYQAYAEMNQDSLPYAAVAPGNTGWYRTDDRGRPTIDNSSHAFRLVQGNLTPGLAFVCPGAEHDFPFVSGDATGFENFPDPRNNSYSTKLVTTPWLRSNILGSQPLVADMTPLVDRERLLIRRSDVAMNSHNHGPRGGQNVLRANISVRFYNTPNVGVQDDDIYRVVGVREYSGFEWPRSRSDAFLVP